MRKKNLRFLLNSARLALAAGLLTLLFSRIDRAALQAVMLQAGSRYEWLMAAVMLYGIIVLIGIVRWQLLLRGQGIIVSWRITTIIFFIAQFFNSFFLGSTGGDLARIYYAARAAPKNKTESAITVVMDRLIGMLAIFFLSTIMILCRRHFLQAQMQTRLPACAVLAMAAALPAAALILVFIHRFRHSPPLRRISARPAFSSFIRRVFLAVTAYRNHPRYLASAFFLSIIGHLVTVLISATIGYALNISLNFSDYLVAVPIVLILASIPITPAGLGLREGLALTVLSAFGVDKPHAISLSLMIFASVLLWSLVGGLVFLMQAIIPGRSLREQLREISNTSPEADAPSLRQ